MIPVIQIYNHPFKCHVTKRIPFNSYKVTFNCGIHKMDERINEPSTYKHKDLICNGLTRFKLYNIDLSKNPNCILLYYNDTVNSVVFRIINE